MSVLVGTVLAVGALSACEPAPVSPEDKAQVMTLTSEFQRICGTLARTNDLNATRQAALAAGYETNVTIINTAAYGFRDFEHLTKDNLQVQLSDEDSDSYSKGNICAVIADGADKISEGLFKGSTSAIAKTNNATQSSRPLLPMNPAGRLQYEIGDHTVRFDYQQHPAGLFLYTLTDPVKPN